MTRKEIEEAATEAFGDYPSDAIARFATQQVNKALKEVGNMIESQLPPLGQITSAQQAVAVIYSLKIE